MCLAGNKIGCILSNDIAEFRRRPPTLMIPSASKNGVRLSSLLFFATVLFVFNVRKSSLNALYHSNQE